MSYPHRVSSPWLPWPFEGQMVEHIGSSGDNPMTSNVAIKATRQPWLVLAIRHPIRGRIACLVRRRGPPPLLSWPMAVLALRKAGLAHTNFLEPLVLVSIRGGASDGVGRQGGFGVDTRLFDDWLPVCRNWGHPKNHSDGLKAFSLETFASIHTHSISSSFHLASARHMRIPEPS